MHAFASLVLVVLLGACTISRDTSPPRAATEQLLISAAADRAADRLALQIPRDTKVFVDTTNFEGYDGKYAIGAVRDRLLKQGARLVPDRAAADTVVEVRAGALSIDEHKTLFGIPSFDVPIPLAGPLKFPEIALFKKQKWQGIAKIAATGYDAKGGALVASSGPEYGFSHKTYWVVMLFISWTTDDLGPDGTNPWEIFDGGDGDPN
jgi:hypothetical protein